MYNRTHQDILQELYDFMLDLRKDYTIDRVPFLDLDKIDKISDISKIKDCVIYKDLTTFYDKGYSPGLIDYMYEDLEPKYNIKYEDFVDKVIEMAENDMLFRKEMFE